MGFDGPDMVSNALLEIAQPRTGLFAHLKTIDPSMFDAVDAGAISATAFNCNLAGLYDTVMKAFKAALGDEFIEVEEAISEIETELKIKIRDGLLASLEGPMVFYSVPGGVASGSPQGAFALVAKLKEAGLWKETLTALGQFAAAQSEGMVQISAQEHKGRTIHTWTIAPLAMLYLMPSWCIAGDKVVIGSNPTFLRSALDQLDSGGKSIRSTEGFKNVTAKLPGNLISLKYSDSKLQFNQMMMGLQQFWPMVTMGAMQADLKLPAVLPNLSHIAEHMGPSCQYSWFDDRGLRSHYRGTGIEPSFGAAAGAGVGMGILMPALARAKQQAKRTVSASNLKQLGLVLIMYAEDQGAFPERLEQAKNYFGDSKILESPLKPEDFDGPSYIYVAGQKKSTDPDQILVYENPAFSPKGVNVLFMDGHVEWMEPDAFRQKLEATYKQLGREMPKIEFKNP
jgi:prepilin-type processing-associated H-X9-DG protein